MALGLAGSRACRGSGVLAGRGVLGRRPSCGWGTGRGRGGPLDGRPPRRRRGAVRRLVEDQRSLAGHAPPSPTGGLLRQGWPDAGPSLGLSARQRLGSLPARAERATGASRSGTRRSGVSGGGAPVLPRAARGAGGAPGASGARLGGSRGARTTGARGAPRPGAAPGAAYAPAAWRTADATRCPGGAAGPGGWRTAAPAAGAGLPTPVRARRIGRVGPGHDLPSYRRPPNRLPVRDSTSGRTPAEREETPGGEPGVSSANYSGGDLLSQGVSPQVPSALAGLTSVFGMGTGVTPPLWPPETLAINGQLPPQVASLEPSIASTSVDVLQALGRLVPVG